MGPRGFEPRTSHTPGANLRPNWTDKKTKVSYHLPFNMKDFSDFLEVDLGLARSTVNKHIKRLTQLLDYVNKPLDQINTKDIRGFLKAMKGEYVESSYSSFIKMLRRVFRDYLGREELIRTFKFPTVNPKPKVLPTKKELTRFYDAIEHPIVRTLFLLWCTTGLRTAEAFNLRKENVRPDLCMVTPKQHAGSSKLSWFTFYNGEIKEDMERLWNEANPRIFRTSNKTLKKEWKKAREKTGLHITPKDLRAWFAEEMSDLGLADRYIDAFCGRMPKTVLARHYSDYSWKKQKKRYDKAGLKVLS